MKIRKPGQGRRVLIIVENLPCPFDRRVWQEATTLSAHGYCVSIICPKGKGYESSHEIVDGVHIFRHWLSAEADNALGYLFEYSTALFFQFFLSIRVALSRGFDVIHACNPPDNIFLITDGLPTQGIKPPRSTKISGRDRQKLFREAVKSLPKGVPVNIILGPLEGDPMAASEFWQLAQTSKGAFMSPSRDWP